MGKAVALIGLAISSLATPATSQVCTGNCGSDSANGVVTTPPGGSEYQYVSTFGGIAAGYGAGQISGVLEGYNGSEYITAPFGVSVGDQLSFNFNYVTSDGLGYDYAFAELLLGGAHAAWLFTARTEPDGTWTPGIGLPADEATITPLTSLTAGAPSWAELGPSSGTCYQAGCGFTGWNSALFTISMSGSYQVRFGVTNSYTSAYNSGLAFEGLSLNNGPIGAVPEPATWALMLAGFTLIGFQFRRAQMSRGVAAD